MKFSSVETEEMAVMASVADFPESFIIRLASHPDGIQRARQDAGNAFDAAARHLYAEADFASDERSLLHLEQRLDASRQLVLGLEKTGREVVIDEAKLSAIPWTSWERFTCFTLKIVGVIAMAAVLNTLASVCIASGANPVWVMYPWTAVLFVFAGFALVVGLDAGASTLGPKLSTLFFFAVAVGAIGSFGWWLREIGTLVEAGNRSFDEVVKLAAGGTRRGGIGPHLVWSQVTLETLSGLLCWLTNARISKRHVVKGMTVNPIYTNAMERVESLEASIAELGRSVTRRKEKVLRMNAQRDEFISRQADLVREKQEEARVASRLREAADQQSAYLLNIRHTGQSLPVAGFATVVRNAGGTNDEGTN